MVPDIFVSPTDTIPDDRVTATPKASMVKQMFSSFLVKPTGISFETQDEIEIIELLLRKHPITQLEWILVALILLITPIIIFPLLISNNLIPAGIPVSIQTLIILVWYMFSFTYIFVNFLLWYFTVSIVTNQRIVDIDFDNILHKTFSATTISKVEDVSMRKGGVIRAIFDFGDVHVQTAGEQKEFEFLAVPHPDIVVEVINRLMNTVKGH